MDPITQRLWRGVEGPRECLIDPCCSELFNHRARHGFHPGAESQELASILLLSGACIFIRTTHPEFKDDYRA